MKKVIALRLVVLMLAVGCGRSFDLADASFKDGVAREDLDTNVGPCAPWAMNVAERQLGTQEGPVDQESFDDMFVALNTKEEGGTDYKDILSYMDSKGYDYDIHKLESCDQYEEIAGIMEAGCSVMFAMQGNGHGHVETLKTVNAKTCSGTVDSLFEELPVKGVSGEYKLDKFSNYSGTDSQVYYITVCGR